MKQKTNLAPLLNQEINRIARIEKKTDEASMTKLMKEIAELCGLKNTRMIYHWRSGHYDLPAEHVPTLCRRFGSFVLLDAMKSAAAGTEIEVPDNFDLALQANRALRQDLECYERILLHFEDGVIQPGELAELKELAARSHRNLHLMIGIAEADCARRTESLAPRKANQKSESRPQATESRKEIARR